MEPCYCCGAEIAVGRKVKLRPWRDFDPASGGPDSAAYMTYKEEMTYRWAFVCEDCYAKLDSPDGRAEIHGRDFTMAGQSRGGKATVKTDAEYRAFQRREAKKLGLDLEEEG
jgi:hypothetical protein